MERNYYLPDDKKITMVRIGDTMVGLASVASI